MLLAPVHSRFHMSSGEVDYSSSDDRVLVQDETDPPRVGMPYGLILAGWLRKIISQYHISPDFISRVSNLKYGPRSNCYYYMSY